MIINHIKYTYPLKEATPRGPENPSAQKDGMIKNYSRRAHLAFMLMALFVPLPRFPDFALF